MVSNSEGAPTVSLEPMGFTDILDTIFSLYRNRFRLFLGICVISFVLTLGLDLLTDISTFFFTSSGLAGLGILISSVSVPIAFVVSLFAIGALLFAGAQAYLGRHITVRAAFRQAQRLFFPYLGSNLLLGFIVGVLVITIISIPVAIYFGTRWVFCSQAVLVEENSTINALKRSSELVKGTWWRVFGLTLAILLLAFMIQTILQLSLLFAFGVTQVLTGEEGLEMFLRLFVPTLTSWDGLILYVVQSVINNAAISLTLPIGIIGFTLLYFDLRIRKEGFDIEMRVTNDAV